MTVNEILEVVRKAAHIRGQVVSDFGSEQRIVSLGIEFDSRSINGQSPSYILQLLVRREGTELLDAQVLDARFGRFEEETEVFYYHFGKSCWDVSK